MRGEVQGPRSEVQGRPLSLVDVATALAAEVTRLRGIRDGRVSSAEVGDVCGQLSLLLVAVRSAVRGAPGGGRISFSLSREVGCG